jgi:decaprenyl-phosphate phosphoribosyltransferase
MSSSSRPDTSSGFARAALPYLRLARPDHWFKNAFMLLGTLLAFFYRPSALSFEGFVRLLCAIAATCLIASSNYTLNEILDGPTDREHPTKKNRPVPSGQVRPSWAYVAWLVLGVLGFALAARIGTAFFLSAVALWVMAILYNVPPIRTKEWPYIDVLSESINNPIRLCLGWFVLIPDRVPPVSLAISYWMAGAFFMAVKRLAEYRYLGGSAQAAGYRRSFAYYTEDRLLVSVMFYATTCALFAGIFIVRYRLELILFTPFAAGLLAFYLKLGLAHDSVAQHPERLLREGRFMAYLTVCLAAFVFLMFTGLPPLYRWFNVEPSSISPLWTIGSDRP